MKDLDLVRIKDAQMENGDILSLPCYVNYYLIETDEHLKEAIEEILPLAKKKNARIAIDVETTGFDPFVDDILLLQIGTENDIQYIFDARKVDIKLLKPIFELPCWKAGHNIRFDAKFIKHKFGLNIIRFYDTFLAEMILRGGAHFENGQRVKYSLDEVLLRRVGVELKIIPASNKGGNLRFDATIAAASAKKIMQTSFLNTPREKRFTQAQLGYAAQDVAFNTIFALARSQEILLRKQGLNSIYDERNKIFDPEVQDNYDKFIAEKLSLWNTACLEFKFLEVVIDMELAGMGFCIETHNEVLNNIKQDYQDYRKEFLKLLGPITKQQTLFGTAGVNPDSPLQTLNILNELNLKLEDTSAETLDEKLREMKEETLEYKVLDSLIKYRTTAKLVSSFGEKLAAHVHPVTGRMHPQVKQILDTGRIATSNPNCQQIVGSIEWKQTGDPELDKLLKERPGIRECFKARPGYSLVIADYSQQELRVAASISLDQKMIKAFKDGKELHSYSATLMYDEDYDDFVHKVEVLKDKEAIKKRKAAKTVSFGALYGSGAPNLAKTLGIALEAAKDILKRYWDTYVSLAESMKRFGIKARELGYSNTVLGRRRYYSDLLDRIRWIRSINNYEDAMKKVKEMKMEWFLQEHPIIDSDFLLEKAKMAMIRKHEGEITRQAGNHHIQGTSADMTKLAAIYIYDEIREKNYNAKIIALVHDEIIVESLEDIENEIKELVSRNMKKAMLLFCPNMIAKADATITKCWKKD